MTKPFDLAWVLLKATMQRRLDTPSARDLPDFFTRRPTIFRDPVKLEIEAEQRHRKLLDAKDRFKQQLNQNIPYLRRNEQGDYALTVGDHIEPGSIHGDINTTTADGDFKNNWTSLDGGEVANYAQRQGLYGRALQGIINDAGNLTSYARNENSQPFHEQFNPVSATKKIEDNSIARNNAITYTAKPPKETPREFGDLQYDTGALPVYQTRFDEGNTDIPFFDRTGRQQTLAQHTYIPTPGGVTYGR
tara:strand:- start:412 stop:1152 length:741 start_codon:yes stop_codon:yes gene_type:complete